MGLTLIDGVTRWVSRIEAVEGRTNANVVLWGADGGRSCAGALGGGQRSHADGATGLLHRFLTLTGLWSGWQDRCPLSYTSPDAPSKADVLGTWMLSILSGHRRYSHVTTIRCARVNPVCWA